MSDIKLLAATMKEWSDTVGDHHWRAGEALEQMALALHQMKKRARDAERKARHLEQQLQVMEQQRNSFQRTLAQLSQ